MTHFAQSLRYDMYSLTLKFSEKITPHQRKFSWNFSRIFCVNMGPKIKPVGSFKRWYNFAKCGCAACEYHTVTVERAYARPHSRWANVVTKLIKKLVMGMKKKVCYQNFGSQHLTADSTAKSAKAAAEYKSSNGLT